MEAWIFISIAAAAFQTLRFMLQKSLSMGTLSAVGATSARFFYAAPFAFVLAVGYLLWQGEARPQLGGAFWPYVVAGGLSQILATFFVVLLFAQRNFAVGITLKKTEVIQTALVGVIVLGDKISLTGFVAILIGLIGVLVLSDPPEGTGKTLHRFANRAAGLGLASGVFFAVSAVCYRGATLQVAHDDPLLRATLTVSAVTLSQSLFMVCWFLWRDPKELANIWRARRKAVWMGVTSLAGSVSWFTAFTLQNAAYVFAVGQIEVIFSLMASVLVFKETVSKRELLGIALLTASIIFLVLLA